MCVSVRKIGGIGSTASLGGRDRENLLSAHDTYRPHVHWMCIRREWTTHGHAHRPSCGALRALSFNESNTRSRITCSLCLSLLSTYGAKTSVANARRRSRSWPDLRWASPCRSVRSGRRPPPPNRSQVVRARKGGPVISGPRSAAGTRQLARSRVLKDTAQPGASGEKGMSCEPRYDGKSFFSQSMLGMKWFLGGLNGTKTFYFGVDVVTECLSICSSICTSDKQSDKRIIASSTRKLTNCQPNCLRPLASLLKTKCFFCFF